MRWRWRLLTLNSASKVVSRFVFFDFVFLSSRYRARIASRRGAAFLLLAAEALAALARAFSSTFASDVPFNSS